MSDFISFIQGFFLASPIVAWAIVGFLVAILLITILWEKVKWFLFNLKVDCFSLRGWAKDYKNTETRNGNEWYKAETNLGAAYKKHIPAINKIDYDSNDEYINAVGDNGAHIMPKLIWLLIVVIVLIEAFGFSYVLAGWAIPGVSENNQQIAGFGIAALVAIALVALTHIAGSNLNKALAIKKARNQRNNAAAFDYVADVKGKKTQVTRALQIANGKFPLGTGRIALNYDQLKDKDEPDFSRAINRIQSGTKPTYYMLTCTIIAILIIATGSTYIRGQVLEEIINEDVVGQKEDRDNEVELSSDGLVINDGDDGEVLPPTADLEQAKQASYAEIERSAEIPFKGGWATFVVLAFIFLFIQIISIYFSYHWSFVGKATKAAYIANKLNKYGTYVDFKRDVDRMVDVAESEMRKLHQKMLENYEESGDGGFKPVGTFRQYLIDFKGDDSPSFNPSSATVPNSQNESASDSTVVSLDDNSFDLEKSVKKYMALEGEMDELLYLSDFNEIQRKEILAEVGRSEAPPSFDVESAVREHSELESVEDKLHYIDVLSKPDADKLKSKLKELDNIKKEIKGRA